MNQYLVTWEIDVEEVSTPYHAAEYALSIQKRKESTATVFEVFDKHSGTRHIVDLTEDTIEEIVTGDRVKTLLNRCESFISGFEDDEMQDDVDLKGLLEDLRETLNKLP